MAHRAKTMAFGDVIGLLAHVLNWQGNTHAAGHLLDPNLDVTSIIGRGLDSLILCWTFRAETTEGLTASLLAPMLRRLALNHQDLLAANSLGIEVNDRVLKLQQAARVWNLIFGEMESFLAVPWSSCLLVCVDPIADH